MMTTLTHISPAVPAGKTAGPKRYAPHPDAAPPADRFATLLHQRQQSQPPAKASSPQAETKPAPPTTAPRDTERHTDRDTQAAADGTDAQAIDGAPAGDSPSQASTGYEASPRRAAPGVPMLPPVAPRKRPIAEAPPLPPQATNGNIAPPADPVGSFEPPTDIGGRGAQATDGAPAGGPASPCAAGCETTLALAAPDASPLLPAIPRERPMAKAPPLPPQVASDTLTPPADIDRTGAQAGDGAPEGDPAPQCSTGCDVTPTGVASGVPMLPPVMPREQPIAEAPSRPPQAAIDGLTPSADGVGYRELPTHLGKRGAATRIAGAEDPVTLAPEIPIVSPPFWPGMTQAAGSASVPAAAATDVLTATGSTTDTRASAAASANSTAPGATLTLGRGTAGETGAGGQGGRDAEGNATGSHVAALIAAARAEARSDATPVVSGDRFALPPRVSLPIEASPGFLGHPGGIMARGMETAAVAPLTLATPLHAPDFAKALGAQVSLLARNGLAQAELQLNPAEMGPIRVQIAIEGAHARVDFAAEAAVTRQVIERGLPELASALREQGLTLSGGGVFQRAPDQQRDAEAPAPGGNRGPDSRGGEAIAADTIAPAARARAAAAQRGGVDLYA